MDFVNFGQSRLSFPWFYPLYFILCWCMLYLFCICAAVILKCSYCGTNKGNILTYTYFTLFSWKNHSVYYLIFTYFTVNCANFILSVFSYFLSYQQTNKQTINQSNKQTQKQWCRKLTLFRTICTGMLSFVFVSPCASMFIINCSFKKKIN